MHSRQRTGRRPHPHRAPRAASPPAAGSEQVRRALAARSRVPPCRRHAGHEPAPEAAHPLRLCDTSGPPLWLACLAHPVFQAALLSHDAVSGDLEEPEGRGLKQQDGAGIRESWAGRRTRPAPPLGPCHCPNPAPLHAVLAELTHHNVMLRQRSHPLVTLRAVVQADCRGPGNASCAVGVTALRVHASRVRRAMRVT